MNTTTKVATTGAVATVGVVEYAGQAVEWLWNEIMPWAAGVAADSVPDMPSAVAVLCGVLMTGIVVWALGWMPRGPKPAPSPEPVTPPDASSA